MRKIFSFMHISLDSFVAGPEGEMNWITVNEEIFNHVGEHVRHGDTALYGRVTFQMMESYWPTAADKPDASKHDIEHAAWYKQVRKVVLSRTLRAGDFTNTQVISDYIASQINALKQEPGNDILVFGSPSATHALMEQNLIDGYWLFLNPVLLGEGIPLFKGIGQKMALRLQSSHVFSSGVIALRYTVKD